MSELERQALAANCSHPPNVSTQAPVAAALHFPSSSIKRTNDIYSTVNMPEPSLYGKYLMPAGTVVAGGVLACKQANHPLLSVCNEKY